jgi:predicted amidohydrolase
MAAMSLILAAAQTASVSGDVEKNVAHHVRVGTVAAEHGVQLLVFPELSLIGYELDLAERHPLSPYSAELAPLRELAARAGMIVVAGAPVRTELGGLYIAALAMHPDGAVLTYTKEHVHQSEEHVFTSGPGGEMLSAGGARVALAICADASHPRHAARAAKRGANVYAAGVMIDEPGYVRKAPLLQGYAIEHRMAVLMANYSGVTGGEVSAGRSAIWSEDGEVVAASEGTEEALVIGRKQGGVWSGATRTI